jgi:hypothetical protein
VKMWVFRISSFVTLNFKFFIFIIFCVVSWVNKVLGIKLTSKFGVNWSERLSKISGKRVIPLDTIDIIR